jgi:hypothetical protein
MSVLQIQNVEGALAMYLDTLLDVDTGTRVPNPRPAAFVRVQRIGGAEANMVQERPLILIECWGSTEVQAWQLAQTVYSALQGPEPLEFNGIDFGSRAVSSPVNYPDPSTTSPRYQLQLQTTVNLKGASS